MEELSLLLTELNAVQRSAFAKSLRAGLDPRELDAPWLALSGALTRQDGSSRGLTSHQEKMCARSAAGLRKTARATSAHRAEADAGHADAIAEKIERERVELAKLRASKAPLERTEAFEKRRQRAKRAQQNINRLTERKIRFEASAQRHSAEAKTGRGSRVFGSRKLLSQRMAAGEPGSPFKSVADWEAAWSEARDGAWLFEGDKQAPGGNKEAKWDAGSGVFRIRLTEERAEARMALRAAELGVPLSEIKESPHLGGERRRCRYLRLSLDLGGKGQAKRLARFLAALTPVASPTPKDPGRMALSAPISWLISVKGGKARAGAQWEEPVVPTAAWPAAGRPWERRGEGGPSGLPPSGPTRLGEIPGGLRPPPRRRARVDLRGGRASPIDPLRPFWISTD